MRRACSVARVVALAALLLAFAGCSVLLPRFEDADGASFVVAAASGTFTFTSGTEVAQEPVLYVGGVGLATSEPDCRPVGNGIACWRTGFKLGAGESWSVVISGADYSGNVTFYRPGSDVVHRAFLQSR